MQRNDQNIFPFYLQQCSERGIYQKLVFNFYDSWSHHELAGKSDHKIKAVHTTLSILNVQIECFGDHKIILTVPTIKTNGHLVAWESWNDDMVFNLFFTLTVLRIISSVIFVPFCVAAKLKGVLSHFVLI